MPAAIGIPAEALILPLPIDLATIFPTESCSELARGVIKSANGCCPPTPVAANTTGIVWVLKPPSSFPELRPMAESQVKRVQDSLVRFSAAAVAVDNFSARSAEQASDRRWATLVPGAREGSVLICSPVPVDPVFGTCVFGGVVWCPTFFSWVSSITKNPWVDDGLEQFQLLFVDDHVAFCVLFCGRDCLLSLGGAQISCLPRIHDRGVVLGIRGALWSPKQQCLRLG